MSRSSEALLDVGKAGVVAAGWRLSLRLAKSRKSRQAALLYLTMLGSFAAGLAVSALNTRLLQPSAFGEYKLIQTVWTLMATVTTFGLFLTGGNIVAANVSQEKERELVASLFVSIFIVGTVTCAAAFLASFVFLSGGPQTTAVFRRYIWLGWAFVMQIASENVFRGSNKVGLMGWADLLPKLVNIGFIVSILWLGTYNLDRAVLALLISTCTSHLILWGLARPSFTNVWRNLRQIVAENQTVGLPIYFGVLFSTGTSYLGNISLGWFATTRDVGAFSLALTVTMPLLLIPNAVGRTFFKDFARQHKMDPKVIGGTVAVAVLSLLGFCLIAAPMVSLLYTNAYRYVVPLMIVCGVACTMHGVADVYNRFLLVHGRSKTLFGNSILTGCVNLSGYIVLVYLFGAWGAVATRLLLALVYLSSMVGHYRSAVKRGTFRPVELRAIG